MPVLESEVFPEEQIKKSKDSVLRENPCILNLTICPLPSPEPNAGFIVGQSRVLSIGFGAEIGIFPRAMISNPLYSVVPPSNASSDASASALVFWITPSRCSGGP